MIHTSTMTYSGPAGWAVVGVLAYKCCLGICQFFTEVLVTLEPVAAEGNGNAADFPCTICCDLN